MVAIPAIETVIGKMSYRELLGIIHRCEKTIRDDSAGFEDFELYLLAQREKARRLALREQG